MTVPTHSIRRDVAWIPVTTLDGDYEVLTLQDALERAHTLAEVTAEPLIWAGIMRFLPGIVALIAREDPRAHLDGAEVDGIPKVLIDRVLDRLDDRLWLRHPDTPFMQDQAIVTEGNSHPTEWLLHAAPATSSKAWWGKPGDTVHPRAGTTERLAQGLVVSWFFDTGVSGKAVGTYQGDPGTGWRPRGALGYANHGLRAFHRGRNLAHTLIANTLDQHVTGRKPGLPLWAAGPGALPSDGALTASTWTGSAYLLDWEGERARGVFTAGRRLPGAPADPDERKKYIVALEHGIWRADPTIPRVPVVKAGEETGDVRPVRALHPSASAVQWVGEWYAADESRNTARPLEVGLVEADRVDVFSIVLEGEKAGPEVAVYGRVRGLSEAASPRAHARMASLSALLVLPIRKVLVGALIKAVGADQAGPLHDRLFARFCLEAEAVLDDLVHAPSITRGHATAFADAALVAFEEFVSPYTNSQTLAGRTSEGVAAAIAYLRDRVGKAVREVGA